jgi:hypothetical protein
VKKKYYKPQKLNIMELKPYFFKRTLKNSHCDYGIVAESIEKCPIHEDIMIGDGRCLGETCCEMKARFMRIVMDENSWIICKETTKMMDQDPLLGQQDTCVVGPILQ